MTRSIVDNRTLSRRGIVIGAFGVATGVVGLSQMPTEPAAASAPFSPGLVEAVLGRVERVVDGSTLEIQTSKGMQTVHFDANAVYWREGSVELAAFGVGEEVVIEGSSSSGQFVGSAMVNLYRGFYDGHVTGRAGSKISSDRGAIRLIPATRLQEQSSLAPASAQPLTRGSNFSAMGRLDPTTGELVALRLYDPIPGHDQ